MRFYSSYFPLAAPATVCEARSVGLVRYPTTLAPASGSVTVFTQCADNAHRTSSSLNVRCNSDGSWSAQTPQCACNDEYEMATVNGRDICTKSEQRMHILPYTCVSVFFF